MNWSSSDIKKTYCNVLKDAKILKSDELEIKYEAFKTELEPLYKMAINSVLNGTMYDSVDKLEMMLTARENMNDGKVSKLHTDMLVGNQLGKEYIYPLTKNPSAEDYQRAINTIKKKESEKE